MSFFESLATQTAAEQAAFATVPQIRDGLAGRISRETYVAYLAQAYHHVRHTVPLMDLARDRLGPDKARYRKALDSYILEETGHEAWILDDIRSAGGDPAAAVEAGPNQATAAMVVHAYDYVTKKNPMGFFGMVFVLEGISTQLASVGAEAVQQSLGLPKDAFTYLTSHGAIDVHHLAFLKSLLDGVDDADDQAAIVEMAKAMFGLFADLLRSIPHTPAVHPRALAEASTHAV